MYVESEGGRRWSVGRMGRETSERHVGHGWADQRQPHGWIWISASRCATRSERFVFSSSRSLVIGPRLFVGAESSGTGVWGATLGGTT